MRVLVTGANGFLGRRLVPALIAEDHQVVGLIRDFIPDNMFDHPINAVCYGGFESVERMIAEYEIDALIHLAAQTQVSTAVADPVGTLTANVQGTWQVLDACRRQKVRRVIIASSDKAYGDWVTPYTEAQPLVPHGIYATSKACGDMLASAYQREYGLSVAITRCGNLYGPGHTNWSTLIPGTIRSVLQGERPRLRSNGGPKRDWLYVDDAVDGYLALLHSDAVGAFNFGSGFGVPVMAVVEMILSIAKVPVRPIIEDKSASGSGGIEINNQFVDASKAQRVLGWSPKTTLEQGLVKTIEWYRHYLKGYR